MDSYYFYGCCPAHGYFKTVGDSMDLAEIFTLIIEFGNTFVEAVQYIFTLLTVIITSLWSIWDFVTSALQLVYSWSTIVPSWLWAFPLSYVSFRLVVFIKNFVVGGDN